MNLGGVYGFTFLPLFPISCESGVPVALSVCYLLPMRASEQGNVIGSVRIYIYQKNHLLVNEKERCRDG